MNVLAIETASEVGSVGILAGDAIHAEPVGVEQHQSGGLLLAVERCLARAGLVLTQCDAIAVDTGPGSFTGLRVGLGVAQGLAYGADLPVVPVSSLQALAQACRGGPVLALLDARMQEVYWGCFMPDTDGWMQPLGDEQVSPPEAVVVATQLGQAWRVAGNGWERYRERFSVLSGAMSIEVCDARQPHAREIARLGAYFVSQGMAVSPLETYPRYLRNKVANKP